MKVAMVWAVVMAWRWWWSIITYCGGGSRGGKCGIGGCGACDGGDSLNGESGNSGIAINGGVSGHSDINLVSRPGMTPSIASSSDVGSYGNTLRWPHMISDSQGAYSISTARIQT
jgi:hypothetical protein